MTSNNPVRKISSALLAALLLCGAPSFGASTQANLRYSVVVDTFENKSKRTDILGDECSTLLTSKLHESGHFIVVAQTDMQLKALNEQLRGGSGTTTQGRKTAVRGQMTPAQLLVKGTITQIKDGASDQGGGIGVGKFRIKAGRKTTEIRATMQMIDASTGALVASKEFTGIAQARGFSIDQNENGDNVKMGKDDNVQEAFEKAITAVIPWMVAQLPSVRWRGTVVKVDKERIIVNRGTRDGVTVGTEFIVGESDILRDPDTGEVLDEVIHERARIKVVTVSERTSVCTVVSGASGQVVERMAIQFSNES